MGEKLLCVVKLSWYNLSRFVEVTFNDYCGCIHLAAERVNDKLNEKRPALVDCQNVIPLDDNARLHTERVTQATILQLQWFILRHPPYSLNLPPTHYQPFCFLQNFLNGKILKSDEQVRQTVEEFSSRNQPHFTRMAFVNCQMNGRRS